MAKSWQEKLNNDKGLPKVEKIPPRMAKNWGKGTIVIPAPREVDEIMKKVPKGKLITINEIRKVLARKHRATIGCPITSGIFAWISAWNAFEEEKAGKKRITPWWRTLKGEGLLNEKYPGKMALQKKLLAKEGHKVIKKGKKYLVEDYEKSLAKIH